MSSLTPPPPKREETLTFPPAPAALITPYLPPPTSPPNPSSPSNDPYPHVTLTYASSLDAAISLGPGVRTTLSGPQSKAMTHFLRARHDAILVGAGTAVADDPGLNSRLSAASSASSSSSSSSAEEGGKVKQPRPVVLDPRARWEVHRGSKVVEVARRAKGLGPWVVVGKGVEVAEGRRRAVEEVGGRFIRLEARGNGGRFEWEDVLRLLKTEGVGSVMVEGGGEVIKSLLAPPGNGFVDSVVVTIAPTWLGQGGVDVVPPRTVGEDGRPAEPVRLRDVTWCPLGEDVVLCGRVQR